MQANQKLYDEYGDVLNVESVSGKEYKGVLMVCKWFATGKSAPTPTNVQFTDDDMGVKYFFSKEDVGNRARLLDPQGPYCANKKNIERKFEDYMRMMSSSLPYGTLMFGDEKQKVINSFFDKQEKKKEQKFISTHKMCFARMDLDSNYRVGHEVRYFDEHFHDVLYITRGQYCKLGNIQIVNWRSEIATMYYSKSMLEYSSPYYLDVFDSTRESSVPGIEYHYSLMLRREFTQNPYMARDLYVYGTPQIVDANTEEEIKKTEQIQELYKEGGIDPFLLQIIEEKRLENRLTDIITSIQANQNAMIRHTPKQNMIIQGCAGSGKTMILLHRISYLKYNNYLRSFKRAAIIVPNTNFSMFIDELSENLEINQIPRYTMSQYYLELISKYQSKIYLDARESKRDIGEQISKIARKEFVKTNQTPMSDIFNEDLEYNICEYYEKKYSELLSLLGEEIIESNYISLGFTVTNQKSDADRLNILNHCVEVILSEIDNRTKDEKSVLEGARKYVTFLQTPSRHFANLAKTVREFLKEKELTPDVSFHSVYAQFEVSNEIDEKIAELREKEKELEIQSKSESRGFLRFLFRFNRSENDAKKKLEEIRVQLEELEKQNLENHENDNQELPENLVKLEKMIKEFVSWKDTTKQLPNDIVRILEEYTLLIQRLYKEDISFKKLNEEFKVLLKKIEKSESFTQATKEVEKASMAYESAKDKVVVSDDRKIIEGAKKVLEERTSYVEQLYESYFDIKLEETNTAKQLFVLLAFYLLHVGKIKLECDFIFVDEAQDYSDIEYRLLRGILDENTIFEVYGDYMQRVTTNRGLDDWEQMKMLLGDEYYELKENYRNTVEIAEYVNEHIKEVFRTIGLHGEKVQHVGHNWLSLAIDEIAKNPKKRVAIIYKDSAIKSRINVPNEINGNCYSVLEAKGLEFESVYVIDDGMTDNEKYISYSRALNNLYIVQK